MEDIKADPKVPFHYIIGVAMYDLTHEKAGKLYLKYGPVFFKHEDILKFKAARELLDDKIYTDIYKMETSDIYKLTDCQSLILTMISLNHAAKINMCTLHHFSSKYELPNPDGFFENMVERANKFKREKKKLSDSRI